MHDTIHSASPLSHHFQRNRGYLFIQTVAFFFCASNSEFSKKPLKFFRSLGIIESASDGGYATSSHQCGKSISDWPSDWLWSPHGGRQGMPNRWSTLKTANSIHWCRISFWINPRNSWPRRSLSLNTLIWVRTKETMPDSPPPEKPHHSLLHHRIDSQLRDTRFDQINAVSRAIPRSVFLLWLSSQNACWEQSRPRIHLRIEPCLSSDCFSPFYFRSIRENISSDHFPSRPP